MRQACACKRKQNENSEREECFDNWGVISWKSLFYIGPSLVKGLMCGFLFPLARQRRITSCQC